MSFFRIAKKITKRIKRRGEPASHLYKEETVKNYADKYKCSIFIETGTYKGEMLYQVYSLFEYLASIEIVEDLYISAQKKFQLMDKIHLYCGNSGDIISDVINDAIDDRDEAGILFWLDGHYSGGITGRGGRDTPIMEELNSIFNCVTGKCVILIDDARCYIHKGEFIDYPTVKFLKSTVKKRCKNAKFKVKNDIIRIIKP